jgi:UDP-N-acetylglucosamine 2-epimerase
LYPRVAGSRRLRRDTDEHVADHGRAMVGSRLKIMIAIGTRPEPIKLSPVVRELARQAPRASTCVCATGQHRELLAQTLGALEPRRDRNLDIMTKRLVCPG